MAFRFQFQGCNILSAVLLVSIIKGCFTIRCPRCENISRLEDCNQYKECADDEICFTEKYLNHKTVSVVHRSGCRKMHSASLAAVPEKRFISATLPPNTTRCYKCAGPPASCGIAIYEDDCPPPNNYCINHVRNSASGNKLIYRGCGNVTTCYKDWYLGSSDDDKCRLLDDNTVLTYNFQCTYCCTKNKCNFPLHPRQDTLYSPTK